MRKYFLFIIIFFIFISFFACSKEPRKTTIDADVSIPSFDCVAFDGKKYTDKNIFGKTAVISFLTSWCKPCGNELLALDSARKRFADSKLIFLVFTYENPAKFKKIIDSLNVVLPILQADSAFFADLNIDAIPTHILAVNGREVIRIVGSSIEREDSFWAIVSREAGSKQPQNRKR